MIYEYRCRECGRQRDSQYRDDIQPCPCGGILRRDYTSVQIGVTAFRPHFNHAVGEVVRTSRDLDEALKRKSEEAGSTYSRIDPGEAPEPKADTDILETQMKTHVDKGLLSSSSTKVIY